MSQSAPTAEATERDPVTETTLPPLLVLSASLVLSWSIWALVVYPRIPTVSRIVEVAIGIAARSIFWLVPCAIYLRRYWGPRWHEPLGLGFPMGRPQVVRTAVLTLVVGAILLAGTAPQKGMTVIELSLLFFERARLELTAPVFEELVFRGLLLGELINWSRDSSETGLELRARAWGSLVFSALVFALVHWPFWVLHLGLAETFERTGPVFVTGLVLGFVFAQTRSVWACVFLHWLNNELSQLG